MESNSGGSILINHIQFGRGKDIIFLHGWGGDIRSFFACAQIVATKYRVTLVDLYGFGQTPPLQYPATVEDYAKSIVEIINHYKMRSAYIVAHSFGGRIAIRLAAQYGYLIDGIVLADSAGMRPRRGVVYYYRVFRHKVLNKLRIKHEAGSEDYKKLSGVMRQTFKNIVNEAQDSEVKKITLPILIIWGDKDKDTPIYMAKRIYKKTPTSSLIVFKGEGHFAYLYNNRAFSDIILKFFAEGEYEVADCCIADNTKRHNVVTIPRRRTKK